MSTTNDYKVFWDAVHGKIKVSNILCKNILDTEHFQRLKRIEQTNARPLFPCAHHDRFIHSLGTYHLGQFVFKAIKKNSEQYIRDFASHFQVCNPVNWDVLSMEFKLACLLHDVGHAPFSHTFERFYNIDAKSNNGVLDSYLLNKNVNVKIQNLQEYYSSDFKSFKKDFGFAINDKTISFGGKCHKVGSNPKEHEKVSAFLVLTKYQDTVRSLFGSNPFNIARMILGVKFSDGFKKSPGSIMHQIYNCFIELLNSPEIDVDKIDYIIRDQWATGSVYRIIDYSRLLSAIYIRDDKDSGILVNYYHKKAINEIIALHETRHNIAVNMHSHPIVKYDDYVLRKAVNEAMGNELKEWNKNQVTNESNQAERLSEDEASRDNIISQIVSVRALFKPLNFCGSKVYLPSDDDLVHFLKRNIELSPYSKEWLSRDYHLKAVWKSPYDFNYQFRSLDIFEKKILFKEIDKITNSYLQTCQFLNSSNPVEPFYIQKNSLKDARFLRLKTHLNILLKTSEKEQCKLSELLDDNWESENNFQQEVHYDPLDYTSVYFILYLPSHYVGKTLVEERYLERQRFVPYAIGKVQEFVKSMKSGILQILEDRNSYMLSEICDKIIVDDVVFSGYQREEVEEYVALLLMKLENSKEIVSDYPLKKPRKRKFSLNHCKNHSSISLNV